MTIGPLDGYKIISSYQIVIISQCTAKAAQKRALNLNLRQRRITYKQALRGLFVTGTSPDLIDRIGKRSDDEPGLKIQLFHGSVLYNLAGIKPQNK
jgi:hypothetical protein